MHPDTLDGARALALARAEFEADFARHRRWLIIDGAHYRGHRPLFFFVPGPNLVSWYFTFRAIGHYFSMRGRRQGCPVTVFTPRPSPHLRPWPTRSRPTRRPRRQVAAAAAALGLERLAAFVERMADRTA